ncbi:MAG: HD domain-containing protein [Paludibacteraceae bacterium]|nr:HD domain-containing protein [Paludibacteraceae bacterium]
MRQKIINDPVFGFITIPNEFIYSLIKHPFFQRLNRIKQLGLSSIVYPGAQHTRFLHSIGAMFLMNEAIKQLKQKEQNITEEESNAALAAILMHDIGHGPFSHVLENTLVHGISHEEISIRLMQEINKELNGELDLAIEIFKDEYSKRFLHQLISGQLDVDRLDYLRRDSFFSGVTEGNIGSARIIKMLNVANDDLVIEEKGIYSIENFLIARRFMYWQVYYHKTSVAAECMLIKILQRAQELAQQGVELFCSPALRYFLYNNVTKEKFTTEQEALQMFVSLDDSDILSAIKSWSNSSDKVLSVLSQRFINRRLFKIEINSSSVLEKVKTDLIEKYSRYFDISSHEASYFFCEEQVSTRTYNTEDENILILFRNGETKDIASSSDILNVNVLKTSVEKHYLCYTRI